MTGAANALPWAAATFDCVIDIACLQHNSEEAAAAMVGEIHRVLKPGGRHFSLTTRAGCWGDGTGVRVDATSFRDVTEGPFSGMGVVRFATQDSLRRLYCGVPGPRVRVLDTFDARHAARNRELDRHVPQVTGRNPAP